MLSTLIHSVGIFSFKGRLNVRILAKGDTKMALKTDICKAMRPAK